MELTYIRIPLYNLYYVDDLADINNSKLFNTEYILETYDKETIEGIFTQLDWCVKNPNYDFTSLLPNLPFDNRDIYEFLSKLCTFFSQNKVLLKL